MDKTCSERHIFIVTIDCTCIVIYSSLYTFVPQLWRYAHSVDEVQVSKLGRWWVGWQCSDIFHRGDRFKYCLLQKSNRCKFILLLVYILYRYISLCSMVSSSVSLLPRWIQSVPSILEMGSMRCSIGLSMDLKV